MQAAQAIKWRQRSASNLGTSTLAGIMRKAICNKRKQQKLDLGDQAFASLTVRALTYRSNISARYSAHESVSQFPAFGHLLDDEMSISPTFLPTP
jgi:hypothetical protein